MSFYRLSYFLRIINFSVSWLPVYDLRIHVYSICDLKLINMTLSSQASIILLLEKDVDGIIVDMMSLPFL